MNMSKRNLLCVILLAFVVINSCKKEEEEQQQEFQSFESPVTVQFTIPVVANTTSDASLSLNPIRYNVDSVIKANTNNKFDSRAVGAIYMNQIEVTLLNPDANNNTANFENAKLAINNSSTPVIVGTVSLPDTYGTRATLQSSTNVNLKPYISSNNINFSITGKARRATTIPLQALLNAKFVFEK